MGKYNGSVQNGNLWYNIKEFVLFGGIKEIKYGEIDHQRFVKRRKRALLSV